MKPTRKDLLELVRRDDWLGVADLALSACEPGPRVSGPQDFNDILAPWSAKRQEHFLVVTLDGAHHVVKVHEIFKGLVNRALVHPREVFRPAILDSAVAVVLAHNHPSGLLEPSPEDIDITKRFVEAGELLGIEVLDHLIVGRRRYESLKARGLMGED